MTLAVMTTVFTLLIPLESFEVVLCSNYVLWEGFKVERYLITRQSTTLRAEVIGRFGTWKLARRFVIFDVSNYQL